MAVNGTGAVSGGDREELELSEKNMEALRMTLYRFANTSSRM
ncbi:Thiolase-like, subgroup [Corchorus capsularis]|uniref:Thiolase-like, subgroup n=1 Tax=Corchorus capsularis TaxID=210143 RepID=A0A1R3H9R9_COCAP|nr:Thiolase-like, subgroup [Corchorus capsularis]